MLLSRERYEFLSLGTLDSGVYSGFCSSGEEKFLLNTVESCAMRS